jgi:hypothetical protein
MWKVLAAVSWPGTADLLPRTHAKISRRSLALRYGLRIAVSLFSARAGELGIVTEGKG